MLAYSAKKIKANPPPPYSTLNPETSSDSPSGKSKGVRFVSAKQEINQTIKGKRKKLTTNKLEKSKNENVKMPVFPTRYILHCWYPSFHYQYQRSLPCLTVIFTHILLPHKNQRAYAIK